MTSAPWTETSLDTNNFKNQRIPHYCAIDDNQSLQSFSSLSANLNHLSGEDQEKKEKGKNMAIKKLTWYGRWEKTAPLVMPQKMLIVGKNQQLGHPEWCMILSMNSIMSRELARNKENSRAKSKFGSKLASKWDAAGIFSTSWNLGLYLGCHRWHTQLPKIDSSVHSHLLLNDLKW